MTVWAAASDAHATRETAKRNMLAMRSRVYWCSAQAAKTLSGVAVSRRAVNGEAETALSSEMGRDKRSNSSRVQLQGKLKGPQRSRSTRARWRGRIST